MLTMWQYHLITNNTQPGNTHTCGNFVAFQSAMIHYIITVHKVQTIIIYNSRVDTKLVSRVVSPCLTKCLSFVENMSHCLTVLQSLNESERRFFLSWKTLFKEAERQGLILTLISPVLSYLLSCLIYMYQKFSKKLKKKFNHLAAVSKVWVYPRTEPFSVRGFDLKKSCVTLRL